MRHGRRARARSRRHPRAAFPPRERLGARRLRVSDEPRGQSSALDLRADGAQRDGAGGSADRQGVAGRVTPARARFEGQGVLARSLLLVYLSELATYAGLSWWLVGIRSWAPAAALALAVAMAIGWRVAMTLASYAVAWRYGSRAPREFQRSPLALLPYFLAEAAAMSAVYGVLQPFERLVMGDRRPPATSGGLPVVLVPGYVCNRGLWWALARALRARGVDCWPVTLEPVYGPIDDLVVPFAAAVDEVLAETGYSQVVIVAHSMGGLVARAYLRDYGARKVARLITLGSPHHGSVHACLGAGLNAREMEPGSA